MGVFDVTLKAPEQGLSVTALLGDGSALPSGGVGGHEVVIRPGKRPITPWRGPQGALMLTVPMLVDGHAKNESVEKAFRDLLTMGGVAPGDPEPAHLEVHGSAVPFSMKMAPGTRWVIVTDGLEWGAMVRRETDGELIRFAVTATLVRFVEDDAIERARPRRAAPNYRVVRAQKGDTFEKIAARKLGSKRFGGRLARLNGKRSPDVKLKVGAKVKLPSAGTLREWKRDLTKGG